MGDHPDIFMPVSQKKEDFVMFNHIIAALLGLTAIILGVVATIRFDLFQAKAYDATTTKEERDRDVFAFLDNLDATRESRYSKDRSRMLRQLDGFRTDWNSYLNEYGDNVHEYGFSCSCYA